MRGPHGRMLRLSGQARGLGHRRRGAFETRRAHRQNRTGRHVGLLAGTGGARARDSRLPFAADGARHGADADIGVAFGSRGDSTRGIAGGPTRETARGRSAGRKAARLGGSRRGRRERGSGREWRERAPSARVVAPLLATGYRWRISRPACPVRCDAGDRPRRHGHCLRSIRHATTAQCGAQGARSGTGRR